MDPDPERRDIFGIRGVNVVAPCVRQAAYSTVLDARMASRRMGFRIADFSTRSTLRPIMDASSSFMAIQSNRTPCGVCGERDEDIHVAVGAEVVAEHGTEEGEFLDAPAGAERRQGRLVQCEVFGHWSTLPARASALDSRSRAHLSVRISRMPIEWESAGRVEDARDRPMPPGRRHADDFQKMATMVYSGGGRQLKGYRFRDHGRTIVDAIWPGLH